MCNLCKGTGYVVAYRKTDGYLFGFSCSCPKGDVRKLGRWHSGRLNHYSLEMPGSKAQEDKKDVATKDQKDYKVLKAEPKAYDDDEFF